MCPCNGTLSHRFEIYILRISNVRIVRMRCTLQRFLSRYFNSLRIRKSSRWGKRVFEKQTKIRVVVHGRKKLKEFFFFFSFDEIWRKKEEVHSGWSISRHRSIISIEKRQTSSWLENDDDIRDVRLDPRHGNCVKQSGNEKILITCNNILYVRLLRV